MLIASTMRCTRPRAGGRGPDCDSHPDDDAESDSSHPATAAARLRAERLLRPWASWPPSSEPGRRAIQTFRWNFGDGQVSTLPPTALFHTYTTPGSYVVTLTATTSDGHQASSFAGVIVTPALAVAILDVYFPSISKPFQCRDRRYRRGSSARPISPSPPTLPTSAIFSITSLTFSRTAFATGLPDMPFDASTAGCSSSSASGRRHLPLHVPRLQQSPRRIGYARGSLRLAPRDA